MKIIIDGREVEIGGGGTEQNVYSTEETRIGTWINGLPLYRKVLEVSSIGQQSGNGAVLYSDNSIKIQKVSLLNYLYNNILYFTGLGDFVKNTVSGFTGMTAVLLYQPIGISGNLAARIITSNNDSPVTITVAIEYTKNSDETERI